MSNFCSYFIFSSPVSVHMVHSSCSSYCLPQYLKQLKKCSRLQRFLHYTKNWN